MSEKHVIQLVGPRDAENVEGITEPIKMEFAV